MRTAAHSSGSRDNVILSVLVRMAHPTSSFFLRVPAYLKHFVGQALSVAKLLIFT